MKIGDPINIEINITINNNKGLVDSVKLCFRIIQDAMHNNLDYFYFYDKINFLLKVFIQKKTKRTYFLVAANYILSADLTSGFLLFLAFSFLLIFTYRKTLQTTPWGSNEKMGGEKL
ncbi:hypothetical protein BpHYR1_005914 [Brachionus plicatilis]|uniref:Uncharacterized protein n=1 Tax=Brachionus plicatilis TaxID=10195 RepID=A0A3M7T3A9_BRAPC|nr:hypothetical protein BpHYR1_005914 [Brachionus plicatilis]